MRRRARTLLLREGWVALVVAAMAVAMVAERVAAVMVVAVMAAAMVAPRSPHQHSSARHAGM